MEQKQLRSFSFFALSILFHVLFLLFLTVFEGKRFFTSELDPKENTEVTFLDISNVENNLRRQLVEQDNKKSKEAKKDAKYLSKNNKQVKKETRALRRGDFKNKKGQQKTKPRKQSRASMQQNIKRRTNKKSQYKTFKSGGDLFAGEDLPETENAFLRPNSMQKMAASAPIDDVSQNNDYLKDVEVSAETHLNTRQFLYFSYYNRIKKRLRQYWEPMIHDKVDRLIRRGRRPASIGSKMTRLIITLNQRGSLTRVQLRTTSGLEDLDDAAVEAFKAAAPFPNPPKDLVKNGNVKINWDFILET